MVINTNIEATRTANNLTQNQSNLAKSLMRLSSGERIVNPSDDAAGLAVSSRLNAQVRRLEAAQTNVVNAVSFTQVQDGFMRTIDKALSRMGELAMLARDQTKNPRDRALYDQEFQQIMEYVNDTRAKEFNSVPLFDGAKVPVTIDTEGETFDMPGIDMDASGYTNALNTDPLIKHTATATAMTDPPNTWTGKISVPNHNLTNGQAVKISSDSPSNDLISGQVYYAMPNGPDELRLLLPEEMDLTADPPWPKLIANGFDHDAIPTPITYDHTFILEDWSDRIHIQSGSEADNANKLVTAAIARLAQDRSALGAVQSRLNFTNDQLASTKENLTSAISRIVDVDVAKEATKYARNQILVQSGAQMLTKANELPNIALRLLGG